MRTVDEQLVAGVGMDGRHEALLDAEGIVEHLDEGDEAVGRAAGVGDDLVLLRLEVTMVDAVDERGVGSVARRRHDHQRRSGVEVNRRLDPRGEDARRLDDHVDAEVTPRQLRRVADLQHLELVLAHGDAGLGDLDRLRIATEHGVELQQVGHRVEAAEVVDGDEVEVRSQRLGGAEEVAPDASEAVDAYTNSHGA